MPKSITRMRLPMIIAAIVGVAATLTGCTTATPDTDDATTAPDSEAGEFPVTVDAAYGEVTVPSKPEQIVALGAPSLDFLASIGVQPVAFSEAAYGGAPDEEAFLEGNPWLEDQYTAELSPELSESEGMASVEAIAALEPDLIVAGWWNVDEEIYAQLSEIAPTFVGLERDQNTAWRDFLESLGTVTGESEAAAATLEDLESDFREATERLPGLQGKTYNSVAFVPTTGEFMFAGPSFWTDIGLQPAESQGVQTSSRDSISLENIEKLNGDVLQVGVWTDPDAQETLEADPRFTELPAYENETVLYSDHARAAAENSPGPLSLSWLLEQVVPVLEESALNSGD